jgi:hypothetical protein
VRPPSKREQLAVMVGSWALTHAVVKAVRARQIRQEQKRVIAMAVKLQLLRENALLN